MHKRIIPDVVKEQDIKALYPSKTVHDAIQTMSTYNIAAIPVVDNDDHLIGIVSERDITHRVLALGLNPQATRLADVMTENPEFLRPNDTCLDAIDLMLNRNIRHLPVVGVDNTVVAMISMRDLLKAAVNELNLCIDTKRDEAFRPED